MEQYWLIIYTWPYSNVGSSTSQQLWKGSIADWIIEAHEPLEYIRILNAISLDKDDYNKLKKIENRTGF